MDELTDTVETGFASEIESVHNDLSKADDNFVSMLISALADDARDVAYLDDISVHTIDRAGDSPHDHINRKEVVSGDATAWFAVNTEYGEEIEKVDIQYGIYAGSEPSGELVYDPIEVEVIPK